MAAYSNWNGCHLRRRPVSVVSFIAASLATGKIDPPKILTDIYGKPVSMKNALGWSRLNEEPVEASAGPSNYLGAGKTQPQTWALNQNLPVERLLLAYRQLQRFLQNRLV